MTSSGFALAFPDLILSVGGTLAIILGALRADRPMRDFLRAFTLVVLGAAALALGAGRSGAPEMDAITAIAGAGPAWLLANPLNVAFGMVFLATTAWIVAATSRPVLPKTPGATLREDLFYRLAVLHIELPPLRERRSDIPVLVQSFLQHLAGPRRAVSEAAMACLLAHDWPGNVRELLHVLERASVMSASEVLDEADLALPAVSASAPASIASDSDGDDLDLRRATATLERRLIEKALVRSSGNRAEAARLLGIGRPNLYAKMRELGLS